MVSNWLVAIELIPTKSYSPTDLGSLAGLTNEVLTQSVTKGHAISSDRAQRPARPPSRCRPGMDASDRHAERDGGLAGYLQPGSRVDVYANITKVSTASSAAAELTLPLPCTELAMANIQVLDVQSTVPSYASQAVVGAAAPSRPVETLLLARQPEPGQVRSSSSRRTRPSRSSRPRRTRRPPPLGQCIGTDQTTSAP